MSINPYHIPQNSGKKASLDESDVSTRFHSADYAKRKSRDLRGKVFLNESAIETAKKNSTTIYRSGTSGTNSIHTSLDCNNSNSNSNHNNERINVYDRMNSVDLTHKPFRDDTRDNNQEESLTSPRPPLPDTVKEECKYTTQDIYSTPQIVAHVSQKVDSVSDNYYHNKSINNNKKVENTADRKSISSDRVSKVELLRRGEFTRDISPYTPIHSHIHNNSRSNSPRTYATPATVNMTPEIIAAQRNRMSVSPAHRLKLNESSSFNTGSNSNMHNSLN
jgi:hypothetical protein